MGPFRFAGGVSIAHALMYLQCATQKLDLTRPVVMGVVNVTPDSFSDGGGSSTRRRPSITRGSWSSEGAAILDIGGESTRPGAAEVSVEEELRRVVPVVEALAGRRRRAYRWTPASPK